MGSDRLSPNALRIIEESTQSGDPVYLPSICLVEVIYLVEKGRVPFEALEKLLSTLKTGDSDILVAPLDFDVAEEVRQVSRDAVPDMPDRIIAATARNLGLPLVTRDHELQGLGIQTIW